MKCPMCRESHALIAVASPTDQPLYRCSECGELVTPKAWGLLRTLHVPRELTDHVDLMVDEFKRIKSLCHDKFLHNTEIAGLCDRAITNTVQRVPVILQRDQAEQKVAMLESAIIKTLNENGHLADGENCTLID